MKNAVAVGAMLAVLLTVSAPSAQAAKTQADFTAMETEIDSAIATFTAANIGSKNVKYFTDHLSQARKFVGMAASHLGGKKQRYSADFKHALAQLKIVAHNLRTNRGRKISDQTVVQQLKDVADKLVSDWTPFKNPS